MLLKTDICVYYDYGDDKSDNGDDNVDGAAAAADNYGKGDVGWHKMRVGSRLGLH